MSDNVSAAASAEKDFIAGDISSARRKLEGLRASSSAAQDARVLNNILALDAEDHSVRLREASARLHDAVTAAGSDALSRGMAPVPVPHCCAALNLAAMYFHQCRFRESSQLLWKLFLQVDSFSPAFGIKLSFLLLDSLLRSWETVGTVSAPSESRKKRFADVTDRVVSYVSGFFSATEGQVGKGPIGDDFSGSLREVVLLKLMIYQCRISMCSAQQDFTSATPLIDDVFNRIRSMEHLRDADTVLAARKPLSSSCLATAKGANGDDELISPIEFQTILFLQARKAYVNRDFLSSLQLLSRCLAPLSSTVNLVKALEASSPQSRQPAASANPLLPIEVPRPPEFVDVFHIVGHMIYLNNLACIHNGQGNKELSCLYAGKALAELSKLESVTESSSLCSLMSPVFVDDILYNAALSYLSNNMPQLALDCFDHVSGACLQRPLYWLRRAECFLLQYRASASGEAPSEADSAPALRYARLRQGKAKIYLRYPVPITDEARKGRNSNLREALPCLLRAVDLSAAAEISCGYNLSAESANAQSVSIVDLISSIKLRNAPSSAADKVGKPAAKPVKGHVLSSGTDNSVSAEEACGVLSGGDRLSDEFLEACYLKLAYVYLSVSEPVLALNAIRTCLLRVEKFSTSGSFLISMYAVEAFCRIGDVTQAAQLLEPKYMLIATSLATVHTVSNSEASNRSTNGKSAPGDLSAGAWVTDSVAAEICSSSLGIGAASGRVVEAVVLTNRAVVLSIQGELVEAHSILQSVVSAFPTFGPAVRSLVYVLLRRRDHAGAIAVLQKCCTQTAVSVASS